MAARMSQTSPWRGVDKYPDVLSRLMVFRRSVYRVGGSGVLIEGCGDGSLASYGGCCDSGTNGVSASSVG